MRLGRRPADHSISHLVRQEILELGVGLLGGDDDDLRSAQAAQVAIELVRDVTEVLGHELLDVPLEACLRPAALVVPARGLLGLVGDLHELRVLQPEQLPTLATDDRDDRPVSAPEQRHQGSEIELARDPGLVRDRVGKWQRTPGVVEAGEEDGDALSAVPGELVLEVIGDPLEVGFQPDALLVREVARVGALAALGLVDQ